MLIKEVVRAKVLSELVAEQAEVILNQHAQITEMEKNTEALRKTIAEKDALLVESQNEIIKLRKP